MPGRSTAHDSRQADHLARPGLILAGLAAGLVAGAALAASHASFAPAVVAVAEPIGGLWLDSLRMTIVPLVFALLVRGIGTAAVAAEAGGLAARSLVVFAILLLGSALICALVFPLLLALWPLGQAGAQALRGGLAGAAAVPSVPPIAEWVRSIIPANPVKAAADAAMLPLVVFAILFGFAAARTAPAGRDALIGFFDAVVQAMLVIVGWVLAAAPLGVFALALVTAEKTGLAAIGALAHYVAITMVHLGIVTLAGFAAAILWGRQRPGRFLRAAAPALTIGISTQSSLAALPAMLKGAEETLGLGARVPGIVLPMAVALLRGTSPAANLAIVLYVAALTGTHVGPVAMATGIAVTAIISLAAVSVPSQVTFFVTSVPIAAAIGVPLGPLALLVAVETFPDLIRTIGNVIFDMAATAIVGRTEEKA